MSYVSKATQSRRCPAASFHERSKQDEHLVTQINKISVDFATRFITPLYYNLKTKWKSWLLTCPLILMSFIVDRLFSLNLGHEAKID